MQVSFELRALCWRARWAEKVRKGGVLAQGFRWYERQRVVAREARLLREEGAVRGQVVLEGALAALNVA